MKRVLLVNLPYIVRNIDANRPKIRSYLAFPYGVLSIASFNKSIADFTILDCDTTDNYDVKFIEHLGSNPDIIGFGMMFDHSFPHLSRMAKFAKKMCPTSAIICGGAAASYSYRDILKRIPEIDMICFSEGEIPLRDFIRGKYNSAWQMRSNFDARPYDLSELVNDLDTVIDIDYSLVDPTVYDMKQAFSPFADNVSHNKQFFLMTSRGCPFSCSFCSNSYLHGKKMRFASVPKIIEHVEKLVANYGMDVLTIYDDQLLINKNRAKQLFRELKKFNLRIEMPNGLSPAYLDEDICFIMKDAGVDTAYLAIEHGSPFILENVIKKPLKIHMVKPAIDWLHNAGIFVHGFFVIGMPGETQNDRDMTVDFILKSDLDWAGFNPATPVRGSQLYEDCLANGWIKEQMMEDIVDKRYIINAPEIGLTPDIIMKEVDRMNIEVNFHNNRNMKAGRYDVAARCFKEVLSRYSGHEIAKHYLDVCERMIANGKC